MNRINKKITGALLGLSLFAVQSFAALISVSPSEQLVSPGELFTADVSVSGLGEHEDIGAFDFDLAFDPEVLELVSVSFTDALGVDAFNGSTKGVGEVNVYGFAITDELSFQSNEFTLATATFKAVKQGSVSPLALSIRDIGDFYGEPMINVSAADGKVTVPEPSTALMLGSSMFMLGSLMLRRRSEQ